MINNFSNEQTSIVFETIANDPDAYDCFTKRVHDAPAAAVQEIRTFIEERTTRHMSPGPSKDFVEASLRGVKWNEIRQQLAKRA